MIGTESSVASFIDDKHPLDPAYKDLWDRLVPSTGKCDTIEGELLRAASRIYHDYTCNGFGNNWTGALRFLDEEIGLKKSIRDALKRYANCRICKGGDYMYVEGKDPILAALDQLMETVVILVMAKDKDPVSFTPNTRDMLDLNEKSRW